MDYGQRDAPIAAHVLKDLPDIVIVFRGNFATFENLAAEGVKTNQKNTTPLLTCAIHMKDVAAAAAHISSQKINTFLVDGLKVRDEFVGEIAHRARWDLKAKVTRKLDGDLFALTALEEPRQSDVDQDIISNVRSGCHNSLQCRGTYVRRLCMVRTVAATLDRDELSVSHREYASGFCEFQSKRVLAAWTSKWFPEKCEPWQGDHLRARKRGCLSLLLPQEFVDGYRALFLSSSYIAKISSTIWYEIDIPPL
jgi:hypothetical protein